MAVTSLVISLQYLRFWMTGSGVRLVEISSKLLKYLDLVEVWGQCTGFVYSRAHRSKLITHFRRHIVEMKS